jgi:AraC family ethanolamine operon transcriptional activator
MTVIVRKTQKNKRCPMDLFTLNNSYEIFEEMAEAVSGWNLDFVQLSGSEGASSLQQIGTTNMLFSRAQLSAKFEQHGGPSQGWRTFALMAPPCSELKWCKQGITKRSLMVFPQNGDFSSVSQPGFNMYTVSFPEFFLEKMANIFIKKSLHELLGDQRQVVHCSPENTSTLKKYFSRLSHYFNARGSALSMSALDEIESLLCVHLLHCLDLSPSRWLHAKPTRRYRAMENSLDIISNLPISEVSVSTLVQSSGVSSRTLEYAFLDYFSVTPHQYLKALKLQQVHQDLLEKNKGENTSVASIAEANGFNLTGQFAHDYASMYRELPSETLKREL